jgi:phosphoribosylformylglycinamidine synthase
VVRRTFRADGDAVVLLGRTRDELGGSAYLKVIHGLIRGLPPALDLEREAALQRVLVGGASAGVIRSAHDCAEGGLAVTLAECCFDSGLGAEVDVSGVDAHTPAFGPTITLFGESASRVIVSAGPDRVAELLTLAAREGVEAAVVGRVGGRRIAVSVDGRPVLDEPLADMERVWSTAIDAYFERIEARA